MSKMSNRLYIYYDGFWLQNLIHIIRTIDHPNNAIRKYYNSRRSIDIYTSKAYSAIRIIL